MASTLPRLPLFEAISKHDPDSPAVVHCLSGRMFRYGELLPDVARTRDQIYHAAGRTDIRGERVAFLVENSYDYIVTLLAILAARAIALPLSPPFPPAELQYILEQSEAMLLVHSPRYASKTQDVLSTPFPDHLPNTAPHPHPITLELPKRLGSNCTPDQVALSEGSDSEGAGMMLYTSGTTNRPKGVLLPETALTAQCRSLMTAWKYTPKDWLLHVLPLHHIHGTVNAILTPLFAGSTIEFLFPFNADTIWHRFATPFLGAPQTNGATNGATNGTTITKGINRNAAPLTNGTTAPLTNGTTAPLTNGTTAPLTNGTAAPLTNGTAAPQTNETAVPQTNETAAPQTNGTAAPLINGTTTMTEGSNETAAPQTNGTTAPQTNETTTPLTNGTTAPLTNRTAAPALPSDDKFSHMRRNPITFFTVVPTVYTRLLSTHPELPEPLAEAARTAIAPEHMRVAISGSAALPTPVKRAWRELSRGNVLLERYGMTEVGMALSCGLAFADRVDGSVGWPLPGVEARLVESETGALIADGEELDGEGRERQGEIQLRGANVFREYWRNPTATAKEFVEGEDGRGRWFKTGDAAVRRPAAPGAGLDAPWAAGPMYYILGRQSADIIKSGGEKVSALEVEREMLSLPNVAEAAVLAVPSGKWGQKVGAVVVLRPEARKAGWKPIEMRRALRDRLAAYKIPQVLRLVDTIPRNAMGKVNKKVLVKQVFTDDMSGDEM